MISARLVDPSDKDAMRGGMHPPLFVGIILSAATIAASTVMAASTVAAWSQPSHRQPHKSQPASIARTAPDMTSTIPDHRGADGQAKAAVASLPPYPTRDFGEGLPTPFDLPVAPRSRMRACGAKWQAIKLAGDAKSDTWRDFATKCLSESGTKAAP